MSQIRSRIEATFKSSDTEEFLDRIFYRPVGYGMAVVAKKLRITPNAVTVFSIFVGMLAGHLFYYRNLFVNIAGIILLVWAEALDSTDGQLARISEVNSRYGRILDGFAGNLWFLSIYTHLCLRYILSGGTPWVVFAAVGAAASHSLQSGMADYYRNFYLYFTSGGAKGELDESEALRDRYRQLNWIIDFPRKLLMRVYLNYTVEQEIFSRNILSLFHYANGMFGHALPDWLKVEYRRLNRPLLKYGNILTTNTRMIVLFISVLFANIWLYLGFELTLMNILLVMTIHLHERNARLLLNHSKEGHDDEC